MTTSRRDLLKLGLLGTGSLLFSDFSFANTEADFKSDPHFFLLLLMSGGADNSYTFDARPLSMTKAGKIQNYWSKNGAQPIPWVGTNGQSCLTTPLINPLIPFKDRFSIINGVHMTPSFDGHLQNMNFLFAGGPFGGDSFVPHLNLSQPDSLDGITQGTAIFANVNNHSRVVPLSPSAVAQMSAKLKQIDPPAPGSELIDFVRSRMQLLGNGDGRFSKGSEFMLSGISTAPSLHRKLTSLTPPNANDSEERQLASLVGECFKLSIARSAVYTYQEEFDVHAAEAAKKQPETFATVVGKIAELFKALSEIPFDSTRSLFDVTTVMVTSEMGRTMRVQGNPIDNTGTNHNQFSNSVILGGKGIRPGLVVGASDLANETVTASKAHLSMDPIAEKLMGCPFDFATMKTRTDMPEKYDLKDYLSMSSVINTIYSSFGVPQPMMRTLGRDLPIAPILTGLLS